VLAEGLKSKDFHLSFGSINGLLELGDRQASEILIRSLKPKEWNRIDRIVKGLIKLGEPALSAIFDSLPGATTTQRNALNRIVVGMGEVTHPGLLEGLKSADYRTRMFSLIALNEMKAWIPPGPSLTAYFLARREWSKLTSEEIAIFEAQGAVSAGPLLASLRRDGGASQAQVAKLLKQLKMQPKEGTDLVWYLIAQGKWRRVQRMGAISIQPLTHIVDNLGHPTSGHKWVGSLSKVEQEVHTKKHQAAMRVLRKLKASKS
ncbi:MAG: hypothetical protein GXP16_15405, partial [Gammaproteobacteria bacterium]|nr:hypothetical protein [Gammaproteobacteria bacterium]